MYYLTVGYPLGTEIIDNRQVYQVSLKNGTVRLIPLEYRIWCKFLLGAYGQDVERTLPDQDRAGFAPTMNKLLQIGLLQKLPDGDFSAMRLLKFLRQGVGIGLDIQENAHFVVFRERVRLSPLEYEVWKQADGEITYGEIERRVLLKYQLPFFEVQRTAIQLCRRGLLLSVNREER